MVYLYVRVSTRQQRPERQIANLVKRFPDGKVYVEHFTGTKMERPVWNNMLKKVRPGDTIAFDEVSRMSRDAAEGFKTYKELYEQNIELVFLKESYINTDSYKKALSGIVSANVKSGDENADKLVTAILSAVNEFVMAKIESDIYDAFSIAQKEVDYLHVRTKEGIEEARRRGARIGKPKGVTYETKKAKMVKQIILEKDKTFGGPLSVEECLRYSQVSRNSYFKYKKELLEDMKNGI